MNPTCQPEKREEKTEIKLSSGFKVLGSRSCRSCRSSWEGDLQRENRIRACLLKPEQPYERTLVDVGENTTLGDGDVAKKLVQLLIVADGKLKMTRDDTSLLVVASSVARKLENFGSEVLEDGSEVDGSAGTDTLGVVALAEETVNTTDGESETSLGRAAVQNAS